MTSAPITAPGVRRRRWAAFGGSSILTVRLLVVAVTLVGTIVGLTLALVGVGGHALSVLVRWHRGQLHGIARSHMRFTGITLPVPPVPDLPVAAGWLAQVQWTWTMLANRQTWVLLRWVCFDALVGILIAAAPIGLVVWGFEWLVVLPVLDVAFDVHPAQWYAFLPTTDASWLPYAAGTGAALILLGYLTGPWWLRQHGRFARALLGGDRGALRARVVQLEDTRADARRDAAAELRRIEREVHDGTQSQLVAIGLKLGTAEMVLDTEPERARALIGEAKQDSSTALTELRSLMRGIRPTVLADRGLAAAIDALALDADITITTRVSVNKSLDPGLESAVYFATRELVANAIKHAAADLVTIEAWQSDGMLRIVVGDDGSGGARVLPGHGLEGIRRRIGVYDGTLTLTNPPGGPTSAVIEVPCGS